KVLILLGLLPVVTVPFKVIMLLQKLLAGLADLLFGEKSEPLALLCSSPPGVTSTPSKPATPVLARTAPVAAASDPLYSISTESLSRTLANPSKVVMSFPLTVGFSYTITKVHPAETPPLPLSNAP